MNIRTALSTTSILCLALAAEAPAFAQETTENTDSPPTEAPTQTPGAVTAAEAADAPDQPGRGLEDIVVTAQRRSENLQRAAVPVSAVSGDALISAGISETANLTKLVPSLVVQPAGGSTTNFYLRGVGTLQGNAFGENPIAFNFNGVYIARPTAPVGTFFDLERVEVVKGPQGTLYGRNATGGAINVLPKRPRLVQAGGDLTVEYGNFDSKKASGAVNLPLGDIAAVRLAGQVVDRDGYLSDGTGDEKGQAARASILLKPMDAFSVVLVADYFYQGGKGGGSVLLPGSAFPSFFPGYAAPDPSERIGGSDPRSLAALNAFAATLPAPPFCGGRGNLIRNGCIAGPRDDAFIDGDFYGVSATFEGDVGFGTLTLIPAYRKSKVDFLTYVPGFRAESQENNDQVSVEARLASNIDQRLKYVIGAYFFAEDQKAENFFFQGNLITTRFRPRLNTESRAVFGQATFDVTEAIRVVGGARYTDESRKQSTALASGGLPGPVFPPFRPPFPGELDFSKVTWKAGLEWDVAPRSLLYANVGTGFKAGGFFVGAPPANTFRPEEITAYTLGSKNRFLDNRLQLNLEAFYWDYKDQQISIVSGTQAPIGFVPGLITVNAGQARIYGAEAELQFAVTPADIFTANVQYLNGEYSSLQFSAFSASGAPPRTGCAVTGSRAAPPTAGRLYDVDCSGRPTLNSPEWTANLAYEHTFQLSGDLELVFGARTRLETSRFLNVDYLPEQRQDGYMSSDAFLTLEGPGDRWSLTGFVNNIEDETILAGAFQRPGIPVVYGSLRPPRTYGLRASVRF